MFSADPIQVFPWCYGHILSAREGTITFDGNWKGIKGSPSGQAIRNAVRINDILKSYEVLKEKDLYVKAVVAFTNSKVKLDLSTEPAKCRVVQIKNQADSSLSDYIEGERLRFSEKDIMLIEQRAHLGLRRRRSPSNSHAYSCYLLPTKSALSPKV